MKEIKAIIQPFMLRRVCDALRQVEGIPGITVSPVMGWGKARAVGAENPIEKDGCVFAEKVKVEIVVPSALSEKVVSTVVDAARTGNVGDGKVFVTDLSDAVKIRTGEHGEIAI
jgi:nitrogen regulatory protein P-II 1